MTTDPQADLKALERHHDFFIGIDSDGCAFDTMEVKHKECFIPNTIKHWKLQAVSKYARAAAEFVNLYSKWRGINRFPALVMVTDLLRERPEVLKRCVKIPEMKSVRKWMNEETKLGNPALKEAVERTNDPELAQALRWGEAVNASVADMVHGVPPFPYCRESLDKASSRADMIVVSATPTAALPREWEEHGLAKYVSVIAGQEKGKKAEHLRLGAGGKFEPDHILMIGDAPGDMKAAKANNALFFPINPGHEEESWQALFEEGLDRFFSGIFAGEYETKLFEEFDKYLPDTPKWKSGTVEQSRD